MNLKLEIKRVSDGFIVTDIWPDWNWEEGVLRNDVYWFRDGNASCDCNRELFFTRALGEEAPDTECSEGRYQVRCSDNNTGKVLYDEFSKERDK